MPLTVPEILKHLPPEVLRSLRASCSGALNRGIPKPKKPLTGLKGGRPKLDKGTK